MSRRRYLSTDAGRDRRLRDVARESLFAHALYLLAIPCAGDDCTLPTSDPDELLWEVWPAMAQDYAAADVEAAIALLLSVGLWQRCLDGRLRFPPESFYRFQTYIREDRRGEAQVPIENAPAAHRADEPRTTAHNGAEHRFVKAQDSSSSSSSSSFSPPTPSATEGVALATPTPRAKRTAPLPTRPPAPPAVVQPLHEALDGCSGYAPTAAFFEKLATKYGHLDVGEEALKMRGWLAEKGRRKCSTSFVLNWLKRAAEENAAAPITPLVEPGAALSRRQPAMGRGGRRTVADIAAERLNAMHDQRLIGASNGIAH